MKDALQRVAVLAVHVIAAVFPMLLGWGLTDWRGFLSQPARAGLLAAVLAGAGLLLVLKIDLDPLRIGAGATPGQGKQLLLLLLASIGLLLWLPWADRAGVEVLDSVSVRWVGLGMCIAGGAIRILALRRLGQQFSAYVTLQPEHRLVEEGIYAWIRHPLYLSLLFAGPGVALLFRSELAWPILLVALLFVANRIRSEETLLASHFGVAFSRYRARTWALLPRIY
jgi:protein-S-isoprenylcysteine O-methyltransferase Ste14